MSAPLDTTKLALLAVAIGAKFAEWDAEAGPFDHADYAAWRERHRAAEQAVTAYFSQEHGAVFGEKPPHDHWVKMAGIRASSTSGFRGALGNWRTAARKKIEAAIGDRPEAADDGFNPYGSGPVPIERREG